MSLLAHYRSDTGVVLNGSDVSQWNDQSGNSHHLFQATAINQPAYVLNAHQGHPALRFAGAEYMAVALNTQLDYTTGNLFMFAVLRRSTSDPDGVICGKGTEGNNAHYQMYIGAGVNAKKNVIQVIESTGNFRGKLTTNGVVTNTLHTVASSYAIGTGSANAYLNGALDNAEDLSAGSAPTTTTNAQKFQVGAISATPTTFSNFDLFEIKIYDSLESAATLHSTAQGFWGTPYGGGLASRRISLRG